MANLKSLIEKNSLLQSSLTTTTSIISDSEEDNIENSNVGDYISNKDYDIDVGIAISGLTKEERDEISNSIYNSINEKTSGAAAAASSTESINENTSILAEIDKFIGNVARTADNYVSGALDTSADAIVNFAESLETLGADDERFSKTLSNILKIIADNLFTGYQDGVSETSFGSSQEASWFGSSRSFLVYFKNKTTATTVKFLKSTPMDPGGDNGSARSLFGSLILGTPFIFNENDDPSNRTFINSLVRDGKFVTFTPGFPEYHGTSYNASNKEDQLRQTYENPEAMLRYLAKNGLDDDFANKDKRYYTFKKDFEAYYSYLETMLNTIWIKLGLSQSNGNFNLFTFFENENDPSSYKQLKSKYNKSSIGFFANATGAVSESISSQNTSIGAELEGSVNTNALQYQRLNYITGMGSRASLGRKIQIATTGLQQLGSFISDSYQLTSKALNGFSEKMKASEKVAQSLKVVGSLMLDTTNMVTNNDLGAVMQRFATANGMNVKYPELWESSQYSKNMNINFTFTSPYGDPLSIFKYVYVPFCALLCLSLPRQAAENGFVSPFLVRFDIPGVTTSDLALISDLTWVKGGSNNLWTKDGLPRAIDCTATITDLYPFLAMTKRISFLSANPSYASFLDSLSGMLSIDNDSDDFLDSYFSQMLERINGSNTNGSVMWNKFNSNKNKVTMQLSQEIRKSISATVDPSAIPWMHNSSLII